jgi:hypothetical protein
MVGILLGVQGQPVCFLEKSKNLHVILDPLLSFFFSGDDIIPLPTDARSRGQQVLT